MGVNDECHSDNHENKHKMMSKGCVNGRVTIFFSKISCTYFIIIKIRNLKALMMVLCKFSVFQW